MTYNVFSGTLNPTHFTSPSPKGHSPTQCSAHICCDQMAASLHGSFKMPLGMEVGLSQGDFVLDETHT